MTAVPKLEEKDLQTIATATCALDDLYEHIMSLQTKYAPELLEAVKEEVSEIVGSMKAADLMLDRQASTLFLLATIKHLSYNLKRLK